MLVAHDVLDRIASLVQSCVEDLSWASVIWTNNSVHQEEGRIVADLQTAFGVHKLVVAIRVAACSRNELCATKRTVVGDHAVHRGSHLDSAESVGNFNASSVHVIARAIAIGIGCAGHRFFVTIGCFEDASSVLASKSELANSFKYTSFLVFFRE
jgi:hypothetical protein